jgi:transcriptional regulator with XRE-family HTH domain
MEHHGTAGNAELRDFLRSRRARVTPGEAGLPASGAGRRVPGLRRAEVAQLAGVSLDAYARLEQGRVSHVPAAVLDAVARALRLDAGDRARLHAVARPAVTRRRPMRPQRVRPGLQRVLDTLADTPALVLGRRLDVLAANVLARAFFTDVDALPRRDRNLVRFMFADPAARALHADWPAAARGTVGALHRYAAQHPHDPELIDLVGELSVRDPDFRRWWAAHDAAERGPARAVYHHPVVGRVTLDAEAFVPVGDTDQTLALYTAEPGSPSQHALNLLAAWTGGAAGVSSPAARRRTPATGPAGTA